VLSSFDSGDLNGRHGTMNVVEVESDEFGVFATFDIGRQSEREEVASFSEEKYNFRTKIA
jgi:hypothetical protein